MYKIYSPPEHLKSVIRYYWLLDLNNKDEFVKEYIFAYPYVNWVFTLGTPYTVKDADIGAMVVKDTRILGARTNFAEYTHPKGNVAFGITFQFGKTRPILREETSELTNKIILQDDILPQFNWLTPFFEEVELGLFIDTLNDNLIKFNYEKDNRLMVLWNQFLSLIVDERNYISTSGMMAKKLNISQRHLQRVTLKFSGLTPKQVQSMIRCRLAIRHIQRTGFMHDFFHYGFYDQNHFIKEVKKWSGHTPTRLMILFS